MIAIGLGTLVWVFALDRGLRASAGLLAESSLLIVLIIVVRLANMARTAHGDRNRAHALAAVGAAFVTATNRPAIYEATLVAAVELAGPDYVVVLWELGEDGDDLPLVAASIAAEPAGIRAPRLRRAGPERAPGRARRRHAPRASDPARRTRCADRADRDRGDAHLVAGPRHARVARLPGRARTRERRAQREPHAPRERGAPGLAGAELERARAGRRPRHDDHVRQPGRQAGARPRRPRMSRAAGCRT